MRLTDEMIQEDDKRFKRQNLLAEFNYCGKEVPKRKSITNDDIRFYAWLCRSAYALLKEQDASEWVSVKDRLPNDGQDVLAYLCNGEETRIAPFNYDKGTWYDCVMNCTVAINSITHWMPLHDPPKEVSNDDI